MQLSRRTLLTAAGALTLPHPSAAEESPATGPGPALPSFDERVQEFMTARAVPGAALAVTRNRRLVYARGYGWADRERKIPVRPESLFRIASISKPFTSAAVMQLIEAGKLRLDAPAFELLDHSPILAAGAAADPRLKTVTVRQLLHHTGGWDRDRSFDPMFMPGAIARAAGEPSPAGPKTVIRYMEGKPLQFDPGARFAYSNFGYCVLGRLIEKVTGKGYEEYVRAKVLKPCGIRRMRIGASLESGRDEVRYYTRDNGSGPTVFPDHPGPSPYPYGSFYLEAMDAHGGWVASAVDLLRFAAALDDPDHCPVLKPETARSLYVPPEPPVSRTADGALRETWYGRGWSVRPVKGIGRSNYWHIGSLPGTSTLLVRRWDGLSWAVLFNQRSNDPKLPDGAIDRALHQAADAVKDWPDGDLFRRFD